MEDELIRILGEAGKHPTSLSFPDGTRVLVLPHGGRILGLFAPGSGENFLWTHPALGATRSARALLDGEAWPNSGGDRTWLAPEVDIFLPNYPRVDRYVQPRELDPGEWGILEDPERPVLSSVLSVTLSRSGRTVELELEKEIFPAPNPLRRERGVSFSGVEYAGYRTITTSRAIGEAREDDPPIGIWSLLQMPHGGELLVPTHSRAAPKVYFGSAGPEDLTVSDRMVRWRMRARGEHKIGLRAVHVTGRAGYLYPSGDRWALVIRNFAVDPSGEYVDVPWDDPQDLGYAVQACNVSSALGDFSELEHHAPAAGLDTGRRQGEDVSSVWAFRGSGEAIRSIARMLLSPEV